MSGRTYADPAPAGIEEPIRSCPFPVSRSHARPAAAATTDVVHRR